MTRSQLLAHLPRRHRAFLLGFGLALFCTLGLLVVPWMGEQTAYGQGPEPKEEIVYLDTDGYIQVLDPAIPNVPADLYPVIWHSPAEDGAWDDLAVGDFNGDGDAEIVAVRAAADLGFNLAIYDPVVAPGTDVTPEQVRSIDNSKIPWRTLYTTTVSGRLVAVGSGDFDPGTPGAEIWFAYQDESGYPMAIIRRAPGDTDGMRWETWAATRTNVRWRRAASGNIDNQGGDELAVTGDRGVLHVYRVDGGVFTSLYESASLDRPWTDAAIGKFYGGSTAEVAATRSTNIELPRFFVFIYDPSVPGNFRDGYSEFFAPSPQRVFFADINGNGDDEAFLLRGTLSAPPPPTPTALPRPHLIMRNSGGDQLRSFEIILDADGGYQAGVGADVDGDGRDEIIIARNNRLRIFFQPEIDPSVVDVDRPTDSTTLRAGNLDSLGFLLFPVLAASPTELVDARVVPGSGETVSYPIELTVQNPLLNVPADYEFVVSVPGNPPWLIVSPTTGRLPATLDVEIVGDGLKPLDRLEATIIATVVNGDQFAEPVAYIPVRVQVLPGLSPRPAQALAFAPCDPLLPSTEPVVTQIVLDGLIGVPFTTELIPRAPTQDLDWVQVGAPSTILPTTLTLTFDPQKRSPDHQVETADLVIDSQTNQGDPLRVTVPVQFFCEEAHLLLPLVERRQ